jgi:hypothetical protein
MVGTSFAIHCQIGRAGIYRLRQRGYRAADSLETSPSPRVITSSRLIPLDSSADPHELAITLFAGVQGGALLANALRDPTIMSGQVQRLERWIDTLAAQGPRATVPPAI